MPEKTSEGMLKRQVQLHKMDNTEYLTNKKLSIESCMKPNKVGDKKIFNDALNALAMEIEQVSEKENNL